MRRQVRVTPYPHEDAGWVVAQGRRGGGLFSSDYPHVEGGRNPLKRFDGRSTASPTPRSSDFYCDNFVDLMVEVHPMTVVHEP